MLQYIFQLGNAETDDVMANTAGAAAAFLMPYLKGEARRGPRLAFFRQFSSCSWGRKFDILFNPCPNCAQLTKWLLTTLQAHLSGAMD